MGIDRWKEEHRAYRPNRPGGAEVWADNRSLDMPEDLPIAPPPRVDKVKAEAKSKAKGPDKPRRGARGS